MVRLRVARRAAASVLAGALVAVHLGAPAQAHLGGGPPPPDSAFYQARITAVTPAVPGVTARVDPHAEWIELTNAGTAEVIVLGYTSEPYLRVTAQGSDENLASETTYLNRSMFGDLPAARSSRQPPPQWKRIADRGTVRWHDHRIHWMGQARPPSVAADPTHAHPVGSWTVHATAAGVPFVVDGTLDWLGKPASGVLAPEVVWTIVVNFAVIAVFAVLFLIMRRRREGRVGPLTASELRAIREAGTEPGPAEPEPDDARL